MTSYAAISNPEVAPGAPASSSVVTRMRDNPIAIAEGAPGAPRVVVPTALSTSETNTLKRLAPNGSGGVMWADGGSLAPVSIRTSDLAGGTSIGVSLVAGTYAVKGFVETAFGLRVFDGLVSVSADQILIMSNLGVETTYDNFTSREVTSHPLVPNVVLEYDTGSNVFRFNNTGPATGYPAFIYAFRID